MTGTTPPLAPAVAVVGAANSGKTTLLHLLDRELQGHPDRPLVYVVKDNPGGSGRYLYEAPELGRPLQPRVNGSWRPETVDSIRRWIDNCRASLELVPVDFGGRHTPAKRPHAPALLALAGPWPAPTRRPRRTGT